MCLCMHVLHRIIIVVSHFSCDDKIINAEDKSSMTPLMLATMNKHMEVK